MASSVTCAWTRSTKARPQRVKGVFDRACSSRPHVFLGEASQRRGRTDRPNGTETMPQVTRGVWRRPADRFTSPPAARPPQALIASRACSPVSFARAGPHSLNEATRQTIACVCQVIEHRTERGYQTSRLRDEQNAGNTYPAATQPDEPLSFPWHHQLAGISSVAAGTERWPPPLLRPRRAAIRHGATVRKRGNAQTSFPQRLANPFGSGAIRLDPSLPITAGGMSPWPCMQRSNCSLSTLARAIRGPASATKG